MTKHADLVAFAEDWGRRPTSSQHLIRCLAEDRRILYVNSLGLRRPRLTSDDATRATRKLMSAMKLINTTGQSYDSAGTDTVVETPPNLNVFSPMAVSWPSSKIAFNINRRILRRQLTREIQARNFERPILWTSLPTALPVVGTLNERALVYYCCDDFGSLVGVDHAPVMAMERQIVERADIVFATSDVLAERMPTHKTIMVPHGTDLEHFAAPQPRAADMPSGDKVAGFYGSIDDRLNLDMLAETARRLPDWQFVLIGPIITDISVVEPLDNVTVLGPRHYTQLPSYVQHWQVSMILYQVDEQVRAGNPLKLREYLAAGTPIATIDVPTVRQYADLLSICPTPDTYTDALIAAATDSDRNAARRAAVQDDSWHSRANIISEALADL